VSIENNLKLSNIKQFPAEQPFKAKKLDPYAALKKV